MIIWRLGVVTIRDRGKLKWQSAFFIPEQIKILQNLEVESNKVEKQILDEHQIEQFDQVVCLAMEYTSEVKIKVWEKGFFKVYRGKIHRLDEFNKIIYLGQKGSITKISYNDIVNMELAE